MSSVKRVVQSADIEARHLLDTIRQYEEWMFEYFFEDSCVPDGVKEEDYMEELLIEYYKLKNKIDYLKNRNK